MQFESVPEGSQPLSLPNVPEIRVAELLRGDLHSGTQLVDVREREEWVTGHIPGSIHIPMDEVALRLRELDRSRPVVTVCRSGRRSLYSAEDLLQAGFPEVRSLSGGITAWVEAGQPLDL